MPQKSASVSLGRISAMWIMLSDSFLSIVHKDCAQDELLVRARRPSDIESVFPDAKVKRKVFGQALMH